jgi:hypothetical protein
MVNPAQICTLRAISAINGPTLSASLRTGTTIETAGVGRSEEGKSILFV